MRDYTGLIIAIIIIALVVFVAAFAVYMWWRSQVREAKNYERGLKMVPLLIHLPPLSDDIEQNGRDARDITEEAISQAQVMYNVIASTATSGFKSKIVGQRHISFEIVAKGGLVHYFVVAPTVLIETIKQAVTAAYPTASLEEVEENNLFSEIGKTSGTIGGELTLKKSYENPIATYQESKRDAMRAIINAFSTASKEDGIGVQVLLRPAREDWDSKIEKTVDDIRKGKKTVLGMSTSSSNWVAGVGDIIEALWKPPETHKTDGGSEIKQLSGAEQSKVDALEEKARYSGFETLIRVVASSNTAARSQVLLQNVVSVFSLFDSQTGNGFKFTPTKNINRFVTEYIFRFFPQERNSMILNTIELSTLFHFPDQSNIPTSKVERQATKQVDGPSILPEEGLLLGYNEFRGIKKPIRLTEDDRRRHTYVIGQTGMGKSVFLENMAYQDMIEGRGFAFVDPHGDSAEQLLSLVPPERMNDVIYFDPGDMENPMGMNIFELDSDDDKDRIIQECIDMLYSLYDPGHTGIFGPRGEHMFRNAALLLMADPDGGTWIDIPRVFRDPEYVRSKLKYVTDKRVIDYWTKEFPASQRSNEAGEVITWFISKWGPFESNTMFRNVIGQTKSAFNIRELMDNKKILLANLSKGKMGEYNSRLLGMIFVMKFQTAAMSRVNIPQEQRSDFCLYVDEFQNIATDSFESILSEARKFRLNLIVANQFITQLTDKIREAIIGNVGTVVCGRVGVTDAELMVKRFQPTFDVSDLQDIPNHQAIAQMLINGTPTQPFSMKLPVPMGVPNADMASQLRQLSASSYGRPRQEVERDIDARYAAAIPQNTPNGSPGMPAVPAQGAAKGSFLDDWLAKRQNLNQAPQVASTPHVANPVTPQAPAAPPQPPQAPPVAPATPDEISVDLRSE
ncbi:hypothetical protein FACS189431_4000 [Alphaproteobacteria bacterium]|nr:hypothetical protein FACS189431_4000 [Alphaproteobacteria bacterium]